MYSNITGIILSGGKSKRMGENKSLLKIGNKTIIEHVKDLMQNLFSKVILIANEPDDYKFLNIDIYNDIYFRMGPLAGIHSGLTNSAAGKNFIISCDIPLMTAEMIKYLVEYKTNKPVTIAKADGFIQQLCGLYDKSCLQYADKILSANINNEGRDKEQKKRECKVLSLVSIVGAEIIEAESLPFYTKDIFFNMNKRSDYEIILHKLTVEK
jgi:molybdenum cofactor guanylyltransferase